MPGWKLASRSLWNRCFKKVMHKPWLNLQTPWGRVWIRTMYPLGKTKASQHIRLQVHENPLMSPGLRNVGLYWISVPQCRVEDRVKSENGHRKYDMTRDIEHTKKLLYFVWSPPWHLSICYWQIFWHSIWHIFWHSIWHTFWHSTWHIFWHIFCHPIWQIFWHSIWQTFWHTFWHSIWYSIWHTFWHSIWHMFWHIFWHSIWHIFWHIFWHPIWHSIFWHTFRHSIWHISWHFIWHIFWHSIWHTTWHIFWHSIWPLRSSGAHSF